MKFSFACINGPKEVCLITMKMNSQQNPSLSLCLRPAILDYSFLLSFLLCLLLFLPSFPLPPHSGIRRTPSLTFSRRKLDHLQTVNDMVPTHPMASTCAWISRRDLNPPAISQAEFGHCRGRNGKLFFTYIC